MPNRLSAIARQWGLMAAIVCWMPQASGQSVAEKVLPAVVQIIASDAKGNHATGTAFFVEDGNLVTAYHVVQGAAKVRVLFGDGAIRSATVKAYDPARDIATLSFTPAYSSAARLSVMTLPDGLTNLTGQVFGHPDQKKNFAIKVTFPKDAPLKAPQWLGPAGGNSQFQFNTADLDLIVLDGTLNRGMSGGPVLIGNKVVGVFSGGEQASGGGLGWAIPLKYLSQLTLNEQHLSADKLPPLSMLGRGGNAIAPLKKTSSRSAGILMESSLQMFDAMQQYEAIMAQIEQAADALALLCRSSVSAQELEANGANQELRSKIAAAPWRYCADLYVAMVKGDDKAPKLFGPVSQLNSAVEREEKESGNFAATLGSYVKDQLPNLTADDIKSGYFRRLQESANDCIFGSDFGNLKTDLAPFFSVFGKLAPRVDSLNARMRAGAFKDNLALSQDADFHDTMSGMLALGETIRSYRSTRLEKRKAMLHRCVDSQINTAQSRGKPAEGDTAITFGQMNKVEAAFVGGFVYGRYVSADGLFVTCIRNGGGNANDIKNRYALWRSEWYALYHRAKSMAPPEIVADAGESVSMQNSVMRDFLGTNSQLCKTPGTQGATGLESLSYDIRFRGFAELLEVPIPPMAADALKDGNGLSQKISDLLGPYMVNQAMSGKPPSVVAMKTLLYGMTPLAIAAAVETQSEQCQDWYPEMSNGISSQLILWKKINQGQLDIAGKRVEEALLEFLGNDKVKADALRQQLIENLSSEVTPILRKNFHSTGDSVEALCHGLSSRLSETVPLKAM